MKKTNETLLRSARILIIQATKNHKDNEFVEQAVEVIKILITDLIKETKSS